MTNDQVLQLVNDSSFIEKFGEAKLVETHISWVLLARDFVFKIKKPLHYSFLDFSTLEQRKYFCERELKLNRRLAIDMYLAVVPIWQNNGKITVAKGEGEIVDYAVKMKRMDETRQMNLLLEKGEVTFGYLDELAKIIADFHKRAARVKMPPNITAMQKDFSDISMVKNFVESNIGNEQANTIKLAIEYSSDFLSIHSQRILERHRKGFNIDGHGDLYSQNIFLPKNGMPVVFDCIEFSDHFRQLDVLNELAFFCMDLDYYERADLAEYFLEKYHQENPCSFIQEDFNLFQYFKLYRANVRAKVGTLKAMQMKDKAQLQKQLDFVKDYLSLMHKYLNNLPVFNNKKIK